MNQHELKFDITENLNGRTQVYTLRKWRGRYVWTPKGSTPDGYMRLCHGWCAFRDYNF